MLTLFIYPQINLTIYIGIFPFWYPNFLYVFCPEIFCNYLLQMQYIINYRIRWEIKLLHWKEYRKSNWREGSGSRFFHPVNRQLFHFLFIQLPDYMVLNWWDGNFSLSSCFTIFHIWDGVTDTTVILYIHFLSFPLLKILRSLQCGHIFLMFFCKFFY